MTDNEIIQALEHCSNYNDCGSCDFEPKDNKKKTIGCCLEIMKETLDLINRLQTENDQLTEKFNCQQTVYADLSKIIKDQKAEIERLGRGITLNYKFNEEQVNTIQEQCLTMVKRNAAEIKANAIKEFAERLKGDWQDNDYYWEESDVYKWIDNLVKEMVGEE